MPTIAPTTLDFERTVRAWVAEGSGLDSKFVARQNTKTNYPPTQPYATVLLMGMPRDGFSWTKAASLADPNAADTLTDERVSQTARFSAQWYRDGAMDRARLFQLWAGSPLGQQDAENRRMTIVSIGEVRDMEQLISSEWEDRAQIDFEIGLISTATFTTGRFDTARVEIDYEDPSAAFAVDLEDSP